MSGKISCAIDLSGPFVSYAFALDQEVIISKSFVLHNRNNSLFFNSFFSCAKDSNIDISGIRKWIVGIGPGSFTGLRIASSFALGAAYKTDKETVGISSAFPIALGSEIKPQEKLGVVFNSSRETIYLCSVTADSKGYVSMDKEPQYISRNSDADFEGLKRFVTLSASKEEDNNIIRILPKDSSIIFLEKFPIEKMFCDFGDNYKSISELLYLRPPSSAIKI